MANIITRRCLWTTSKNNFKFRVTDELMKEAAEKRAEKAPEPEKAIHTRENTLIMGRVSSERYDRVIRVAIPKHYLHKYLTLYVKDQDNIQAFDEKNECKPGDWILLRRQKEPIDQNVEHKVERVVYHYGKYIDPITGRRAMGIYFEDDLIELEKIKVSSFN